ncbi:MAG TPA: MFS transporter [Sphingobium sp.]
MVKLLRGQWGIVLGSMFAMIAGAGALLQASIGIFMKSVTAEFGWSRAAFSAGPLVSSIAIIFMQPVIGWLVDRFGVKRTVLPFVALLASGYSALSLLSANISTYYAILFFIGVANCAQTPPIYAKIISMWFDKKRGIALGIAMCGGSLGHILMPLYAHFLIENYGWRIAYIGLGLSNLAFVVPVVLFVLREPNGLATGSANAQQAPVADFSGSTRREALGETRFWMLLIIALLVGSGLYAMLIHTVAMLTDIGWSTGRAVALLSAAGFANVLGRLVSGWILDATSGPAIPALLVLAPAVSAFLLLNGNGAWIPYLAVPLVTFAHGADGDVLAYLATRYFGLLNFGQIYGYVFAAFAVGSGVGPVLMGRTHDSYGNYHLGLLAAGVGFICAYGLCFMLGAYRYGGSSR